MNLTFRKKLLYIFILVLLFISFSIMLIVHNYNYNLLKRELFSNARNQSFQIDNSISSLLGQFKNNAKFLSTSPNVTKADSSITAIFDIDSSITPKKYSKNIPGLESTIYNEFERYGETHLDTSYVYMGTIWGGFIQYPDGYLANGYDPRNRPWYIKSINNPDKIILSDPYIDYSNPDNPLVSASTTIKDNNGNILGVLGLDISLDKLSEIISDAKISDSGYIFLINNDGTIIAHPNKKLNFKKINILSTTGYLDDKSNTNLKYDIKDYIKFINETNGSFETTIDGQSVLVNLYTSNNTGWKIATVIQKDELITKADHVSIFIIFVTACILTLAIFILIVITKKITKPLSKLTDLFEEVGKGNFDVHSDIKTNDEFNQLGYCFNEMIINLRLNKEMELKLRENEIRLKLASDVALTGAFEMNFRDNIVTVDDTCISMLGYTQVELSPITFDIMNNLIHPDDISKVEEQKKKYLTGELAFYESEQRMKHKNGDWVWIYTRGKVIERNAHNNAIRMLGIHMDITKRKKAEEIQLLLMEKEKEEIIKNEFFANISHELKTPINVIYSAIQLESNYISNFDVNKLLKYNKTIKQNCLRLIRLINNIIDITRLETGFFKPEFKTENIVSLIENITLSVISYAEIKNINIIFDTEYEELYVSCDSNLIERIILNLLSNSVKYGREGGLLEVTISKKEEDFVTISVKDDGIGIPEDLQQRVFERFQRVDKSISRPTEGSGIGLSLVKSLVEIQKGTISLKSKLNEGTEFLIKFPLAENNIEECITIEKTYEIKSENHFIEKVHVEFSDIYK